MSIIVVDFKIDFVRCKLIWYDYKQQLQLVKLKLKIKQ